MNSQTSSDSATVELRLGRSLSIDQTARVLRLSRRSIYNRIREGRLQSMRDVGGTQRILVSSVYEDLAFQPQALPTSALAAAFGPRPLTRG